MQGPILSLTKKKKKNPLPPLTPSFSFKTNLPHTQIHTQKPESNPLRTPNPNESLKPPSKIESLPSKSPSSNLEKPGELLEQALSAIHVLKSAFSAVGSRMTSPESSYRVETTSRLAQWRTGHLPPYSYRKSEAFKIGRWKWHLGVEKSRAVFVKLFPEVSSFVKESPPVASFVVRVVCCCAGDRRQLVHPEIRDKQIKNNDDFVWTIDLPLTGRFIIEVEFLDLKIASPDGGGLSSIWTEALFPRQSSNSGALSALSRMLTDSILTDVIIHLPDGGTHLAHRAILGARSPEFRAMLSLQSNRPSTILSLQDMSSDACRVFLSYLYGSVDRDDFLRHRIKLLEAANKYGVADLKEDCHVSLMEDIDVDNVLERLQSAWAHDLEGLKSACLRYLVRFGKVCDLTEEFGAFVRRADKELVTEVFTEILATWKGF